MKTSKWLRGLARLAVALALTVGAAVALLQIPAVEDEFRCFVTETFYPPYAPSAAPDDLVVVSALAETEPVANKCDAADDPAIWINREEPTKSLVLGTNKRQAINVYNLDGELLSQRKLGAPNNVDIREIDINGETTVVVGTSDKDPGELALFALDPLSATLVDILETPIKARTEVETYGFCFYKSPLTNHLYAIATDKSGQIEQWLIEPTESGGLQAELSRVLRVPSQAEGCVADDTNARLFVGEEDVGIWSFGAEPDVASQGQLIAGAADSIATGVHLAADVEGLAVYAEPGSDSAGYLVVSSQGNDTYVLFDRIAPHAYRGTFQVEIDGVKTGDTDGLDVTSLPAGPDYAEGLVVVQDGARAWLGQGNQNFKLVPWHSVAQALELDNR
ncbi:MAG: phytase [Pseudomonadota bacterium]